MQNHFGRSLRTRGQRRPIAIVMVMLLTAFGVGTAISLACAADSLNAAGAATNASKFTAVGTPRPFAKAPGVREWTYTMVRGPSPFDRIGLHRVARGRLPPAHPNIVMLYLPGTNMNGEVTVDDPRHSLPLFMAIHGVDFWALDYRTHFIPPATPVTDLTELKGWTNDLFESDIEAAARYVMDTTGRERIFVAGFSRGASFAYLFAAQHPQAAQGLAIFDGWIPPDRPAVAPPADRYADDVGGAHLTYDKRQALMEAVIANPAGSAPLPKYETARENLEAVVYGAGGMFGGHGGLANPGGGYSDAVVLARMLAGYDRYWPTVQDYENSFTAADRAHLASSKIPVIAFSSTNIGGQWPARVAQSASATGSTHVKVKTLAGWGHLDVICGTHAEAEVYRPTLLFVETHAPEARLFTQGQEIIRPRPK
jgi:pimeloyl-ACP methyl ester carboxylesterase